MNDFKNGLKSKATVFLLFCFVVVVFLCVLFLSLDYLELSTAAKTRKQNVYSEYAPHNTEYFEIKWSTFNLDLTEFGLVVLFGNK